MKLNNVRCGKMEILQAYKKIEDENIPVLNCDIDGVKGMIISSGDKHGIFINRKAIEDSDEEFMVLAHEWGHYSSGMLHSLGDNKTYIGKCEYRADRNAVLEFLPFERIQAAIKDGCQMPYEFADFLDMPEKFVIIAFKHYRDMGLI